MSPASVKVGVVDVAILIPDRRISYWAPALPSHAIVTVFAVVPTSRRLLGALPDGGGVGEGALVAVGVLCTGLAYVLYFRLIESTGPARSLTVTFVIPVFALGYGVAFLGESITGWMIGCGLVIVCGTMLSTGSCDGGEPGLCELPCAVSACGLFSGSSACTTIHE